MPPRASAGSVVQALSGKYPAPQFAFMEQVGNGTGYKASRWADALALSLWPSRGHDLSGFEIKCARNDWMNELKNPAKAEAIAVYCEYWWIVAGSKDIVKLEELPGPWGLMVLDGRGLKTIKPAEKRKAKPLDINIIAAMLRRATENSVPKSALDDMVANAVVGERERLTREHEYRNGDSAFKRANEELKERIRRFEAASGVKIDEWNIEISASAFKTAINFERLNVAGKIAQLRHLAEAVLEKTKKVEAGEDISVY